MFDAFWKAYPRKFDKIKARKAFKKLNPSEKLFNTILSTLEKQKNNYNWKKENRQYMPYPATYLNNRRWEDEDGTDNLYCSKHNKQVSDSEICFEYSHEKQCSKAMEILHKQFLIR